MSSNLTITSHFALSCLLLGMGAHILGLVTDYWCVGTRDKGLLVADDEARYPENNMTDSDVVHVNLGLFRQNVEYENVIFYETESPLKLREEQYIVVSIAGANTLLCLIIYIKAIHIFVGVTSFIVMSLMLLSAFYTFEHTEVSVHTLQEYHSKWPTLALSWSFMCVFGGLLLNILSTLIFLTTVLLKGEKKASHSSKGLGPTDVVETYDKKPIVSVIDGEESYENVAYTNEHQNSNVLMSRSVCEPTCSGYPATETVDSVNETDIVLEDTGNMITHSVETIQQSPSSSTEYTSVFHETANIPEDDKYTDLDAVESDSDNDNSFDDTGNKINTISESIHM